MQEKARVTGDGAPSGTGGRTVRTCEHDIRKRPEYDVHDGVGHAVARLGAGLPAAITRGAEGVAGTFERQRARFRVTPGDATQGGR